MLSHYEDRKKISKGSFLEERVDWTLNQFESEFFGYVKGEEGFDYFMRQVEEFESYKTWWKCQGV